MGRDLACAAFRGGFGVGLYRLVKKEWFCCLVIVMEVTGNFEDPGKSKILSSLTGNARKSETGSRDSKYIFH